MNALYLCIEKLKPAVDKLPADKADHLNKVTNINFEEFVAWQNAKSRAQAEDKITVETALAIYEALGAGGPDHFNKQPLVVKIAMTQLMTLILGSQR